MTKQIERAEEARKLLEQGIDLVADMVKVTMGPSGRNHVLQKNPKTNPQIVNDGVTIAKEIESEDPAVNAGCLLIRDACAKTNESAGDGTTTAAVLAQAMIKEGLRNVAAGANPMIVKRGMEQACEAAVTLLKGMSRKVEGPAEIEKIAVISSGGNDDVFAKLLTKAMERVGIAGSISTEVSAVRATELEIIEGMQFAQGYISSYFTYGSTRARQCVLENPLIICINRKITYIKELEPVLNCVANLGRPLLIIADEIDGEAFAMLVENHIKGILVSCAVKPPAFGDYRKQLLDDIAILTGGQVVSEDKGMAIDKIKLSSFGEAKRVVVTHNSTLIAALDERDGKDDKTKAAIAALTEKVQAHVESLKAQAEEEKDDLFNRERLRERISKLTDGVAIIKIGGDSETELEDRRLRYEDALNATRAALEEGYVPGGGTALLRISQKLIEQRNTLQGDIRTGFDIVLRAMEAPVKQIAENAGLSGDVIVEKVKDIDNDKHGFDAKEQDYCDLIERGVIDPTKVERCALQHATATASMFLTTEGLVVAVPATEPKKVRA